MVQSYLGEIRMFTGLNAPTNWAFCDGSLLQISTNSALYSLLGTAYGGDGITTFGLPDLRGRLPVGAGQGSGLSPYVLGQKGGSETVTLQTTQIPAHSHAFNVSTAPASTSTAGPGVVYAAPLNGTQDVSTGYVNTPNPPSTDAPLAPGYLSQSGGGASHDNMMPSLALNYIISLAGIFPPQ